MVAPAERTPGRAGFVVGRKVLPRAVDRNRFKRRIRASLRSARPGIEAFDLIVRLKRAAPGAELAAAIDEAEGMIALVAGGTAQPEPGR